MAPVSVLERVSWVKLIVYKWLLLVACSPNCETCSWDSATACATCTACLIGYYMADDGTCTGMFFPVVTPLNILCYLLFCTVLGRLSWLWLELLEHGRPNADWCIFFTLNKHACSTNSVFCASIVSQQGLVWYAYLHCVSRNAPTLKQYSSKL